MFAVLRQLFINGVETPKVYNAERSFESLTKYLEGFCYSSLSPCHLSLSPHRHVGPAYFVLSSASEVASFQAKNPLAAIGFVENLDSFDGRMFKSIATNNVETPYAFGVVTDVNLAKNMMDVKSFPLLRVHRQFRLYVCVCVCVCLHGCCSLISLVCVSFDVENPVDYTGSFSNMNAVSEFLSKSRVQFWGELTQDNAQTFLALGKPLLVTFLSEQLGKNPDAILEPLKPIAQKFADKLTFLWLKKFRSCLLLIPLAAPVWAHFSFTAMPSRPTVTAWVWTVAIQVSPSTTLTTR